MAAGPNGEMQMTSSPSAPGSNSDQQGRGTVRKSICDSSNSMSPAAAETISDSDTGLDSGAQPYHMLSASIAFLLQTPAADSQTGPPPLAVAPAQTPQQQQLQAAAAAQLPASPMPPGFMAGMPFPGMLPLPPMLPPGMQAAAGMPGVVPPQFTAAMMQQMQQVRAFVCADDLACLGECCRVTAQWYVDSIFGNEST